MTRLRLTLLALVLSLAALPGCSRCGDSTDAETTAPGASERRTTAPSPSAAPQDPAGATVALMNFVPEDASFVVTVRSYEDLFSLLPVLRSRLGPYAGIVSQVEADLRATLGIEAFDADALRTLGLDPVGATLLYVRDTTAFILAHVSDADTFVSRLESTAERLGEPMVTESDERQGARRVVSYGLDEGTQRMVLITEGRIARAAIAPADTPADALLARFDNPSGGRFTDRADLRGLLRHLESSPVVLLGETARMNEAMNTDIPNVGLLGVGLRVGEDRLTLRMRFEDQEWPSWMMASTTAPGFARLTTSDTYGFARGSINLAAALNRAIAQRPELDAGGLEAGLTEQFGVSLQHGVLPTLGPGIFVSLNRMRALTLMRLIESQSVDFPRFLDALGGVVAIELRNRDALIEQLRTITAAAGGMITETPDGQHLVYTVTLAEPMLVELVVTDQFMLIVPGRQRAEVLNRLRAPGGSSMDSVRNEQARQLVTGTEATGAWIDMAAILRSPLATMAMGRAQLDAATVQGFAEDLHLRVFAADNKVAADLHLRLGTPTTP